MSAPLSRPVVVATVPAEGLTIEIDADPAELARLAAENEVESVERFFARLEARPSGRDGLTVRGVVEAEATRLCVVTLERFVESVREDVDMRFAPDGDGARDADDPPDPIVGGMVDLGAVAAEFFTLGLDPHPRKPGAAFDEPAAGDPEASPFAALKKLARPEESER